MDKILLIDGNQGIYIPQIFAKQYEGAICFEEIQAKNSQYSHLNMQEVLDILKYGPNHDEYWEVWGECLSNAIIKIGDNQYTIDQDADLWALPDGYEENEEQD